MAVSPARAGRPRHCALQRRVCGCASLPDFLNQDSAVLASVPICSLRGSSARSLGCLPLHLCWRGSPPARSTPASLGRLSQAQAAGPFLDTLQGVQWEGPVFRATGGRQPRASGLGGSPLSAVSGHRPPCRLRPPTPPLQPPQRLRASPLPAGGSPTGAVLGNFRGSVEHVPVPAGADRPGGPAPRGARPLRSSTPGL